MLEDFKVSDFKIGDTVKIHGTGRWGEPTGLMGKITNITTSLLSMEKTYIVKVGIKEHHVKEGDLKAPSYL